MQHLVSSHTVGGRPVRNLRIILGIDQIHAKILVL